MATVYWNGSEDGDYSNATNWTGGLPGASDTVIFDGRTTTGPSTNLDEADDILDAYIMPSCTYDIGTPSVYWEVQCSFRMVVEGTGTYHIRCGNGSAADTDIAKLIINSTGTVNLASEKNANGGNVSLFAEIIINNGTVNLKGNADSVGNESGTAYTTLIIAPGAGASPTVNVGDWCQDLKNSTHGNIEISGGTLNIHSDIGTIRQAGGTVNYGSTAYSMAAGDDDISTLHLYGGTFNWQPSVVSASVRTTASDSPNITIVNVYGGSFNASSMLEKVTTDPTLNVTNLFGPGTVNLASGYANFNIGSSFNNYGGTLTLGSGQDFTIQ